MTYEARPYTATNGLYANYQVSPSAYALLEELASMMGLELEVSKLHCTLMYSKSAVPLSEVPALMQYIEGRLEVKVLGLTTWKGHDDKDYIVLCLTDDHLHEVHEMIASRGAVPTFTPYRPHITLGTKEKITEADEGLMLQWNLAAYKFRPTVKLHSPRIEDLKSD